MARHSQFVGEEARDAKSKRPASRLSTLETGKEKEKEEECANYKAEHDPQAQGSDDRTGHCQVEFPAAAKAVGRATSEGTAASRRGLDVSCTGVVRYPTRQATPDRAGFSRNLCWIQFLKAMIAYCAHRH
jgi:hypothetical protein